MTSSIYMAKLEMCEGRFGYWRYQPKLIQIPYFENSGTGDFDQSVAPLESMQQNLNAIPKSVFGIIARRADADHNIVNAYHAYPYMNAWFCWTLKDDMVASKSFIGEDAEILSNANWQDVWVNP